MSHGLLLRKGWIKALNFNGVGRFIPQCQRLTIKFCKSHQGSSGVRNFIDSGIVEFSKKNPATVVYLKPRRFRSPIVVAEYLNGSKEWMPLQGMSKEEVGKWIDILSTSAGNGNMMLKSYQKTEHPSIQGPWNPFSHQSPEINITSFPNEASGQPKNLAPTATDIIRQLASKKSS